MGEQTFDYGAQVRPFLWVFIVVTPLEVLLVELLVAWFWLRAVLFAFGVLSALLLGWQLWMLHRFKHSVDGEHLWLRYAREFEYGIPLAAVGTVRQGLTSRSLHRTRSVVDGTLVLEVSGSTNVLVLLSEPREVDLGRRGAHEVTRIEFWADNPGEVVRALRK